jgi:hypothetical protein
MKDHAYLEGMADRVFELSGSIHMAGQMSSELLTELAQLSVIMLDEHREARFERLQTFADEHARNNPDAEFRWNEFQIADTLIHRLDEEFPGALRLFLSLSRGMSGPVRAGALVSLLNSARGGSLFLRAEGQGDVACVAVDEILQVIQGLPQADRFEPLTLLSRSVANEWDFPATEIAYATERIVQEVERARESVCGEVPAALPLTLACLLPMQPEDRRLGLFDRLLAIASPPPRGNDRLLAKMLHHLADFVLEHSLHNPLTQASARFAEFLEQYPVELNCQHIEGVRLLPLLVENSEMDIEE